LFQDIGKAFLELQFQIFGETAKSHIYNCDTFNENKPASSDPTYLAGSSSAVYNSMIAADPDAIWLMQGWLFVNDRTFWTDTNIQSYLAGVPDHGMVILDLSSEDLPVWNKIAANQKQFIWCMLHNYGGSRALYGNLTLLATDPIDVQAQVSGYFLGTGLTMESIDQNPIVYELMSEMAFHRTTPVVWDWVEQYVTRRYNLIAMNNNNVTTTLLSAWKLLLQTNYQGETPACHHPCYRRSIATLHPTWNMSQSTAIQAGPLVDVWNLLLASNLTKADTAAYTYDLVDVGRQIMSNLFYDYYILAQYAYQLQDIDSLERYTRDMLSLLRDWDSLLSSHESYLLGSWIASARAWAKDDIEAQLFDFNARNQITLWGNNGEIDDYAAKNWGGLIQYYYLSRWQLFLTSSLSALQKNQSLDIDIYNTQILSIGQSFCNNTEKMNFPTSPSGDVIVLSHSMMNKYGNGYQAIHGYIIQHDTDVDSNLLSTPMWTKNIKQLQRLCDSSLSCVGFSSAGLLKTDLTNTYNKSGIQLFIKSKCQNKTHC
jgi:alpha-N-acetylglucosaminidase